MKAVRNSKFSIGPHLPDVSPGETDDFRRLRAAAHLGNTIYHYFRNTDNLANELSVREARLAVQFDPSYEGAHFYLARILEYKSRDDLPEALKIYSKLLDSEDDKTREQARKSYKLISGILK